MPAERCQSHPKFLEAAGRLSSDPEQCFLSPGQEEAGEGPLPSDGPSPKNLLKCPSEDKSV